MNEEKAQSFLEITFQVDLKVRKNKRNGRLK